MRIFNLGNTTHIGMWCAAPDVETAGRIALKVGHVKRIENLRCTDVTEAFEKQNPEHHDVETIRAILDGDVTGTVYGQGKSYTIDEVMARGAALARGEEPPPRVKTTWHVHPISGALA